MTDKNTVQVMLQEIKKDFADAFGVYGAIKKTADLTGIHEVRVQDIIAGRVSSNYTWDTVLKVETAHKARKRLIKRMQRDKVKINKRKRGAK
jgi:hypothetical protein